MVIGASSVPPYTYVNLIGAVEHVLHTVPEPSTEKLATGHVWQVVSTPSRKNWFSPQHTRVAPSRLQRGVVPAVHAGVAVQAVQARLAPTVLEYVPAEQAVHVDDRLALDVLEYVPAEQAVQVDDWLAPATAEYFPAGQAVQVLLEAAAYVPATHWMHAATVGMPVPVLNVPPEHAVQAWAPTLVQPPYVPAAHGVGQARMIMGEYVSPRKAYRAEISVLVKAFV